MHVIKKWLVFFVSGAFSLVLTGCYGVMAMCQKMINIHAVNKENKPIQGLSVTVKGESSTRAITDAEGKTFIIVTEDEEGTPPKVVITDTDGDENGGAYATKEVVAKEGEITVTLEKE